MRRWTAWFLIGVLGSLCVGMVLAAAYPLETSESRWERPTNEHFGIQEADAYQASGRIVVNGTVELALEGVVTAEGAWYERVREVGVTTETYRPSPNGTVYRRYSVRRQGDAARLRQAIRVDEDRTLVRDDRDGERYTMVVTEDAPNGTSPVSGTANVFVQTLQLPGYERVRTNDSLVVLRPRPGWYQGTNYYRLTDTAGVVRASRDSWTVESANVTWRVTTPAESYAQYLLARVTSDDPARFDVSLEYDPGVQDLDRPAWANESNSE